MANMEHVHIVRRGRDAVAGWREQHPGEALDLNACYLTYARIPQVDLSGADLRDADLMGATLQRANLSGCYLNLSHLYRANLTQANLSGAFLAGANLRGANLTQADLSLADLDHAVLSEADLTGANLTGTSLNGANLTEADLTEANLSGATLIRTTLARTNLTDTNLGGCDFYEASFSNPVLASAKFAGGTVGYTVFQNCDLQEAEGLDQLRHDAPSTIGIDSLFRSGGRIPETFLRGAGVPEAIDPFQRSLVGALPLLGDCFISCAAEDLPLAQNLQADLRGRVIRCWLFPDNARGNSLDDRRGSSAQRELVRLVRFYDRLVVLCSAAALQSETVQNDITRARQLQESRDRWMLYVVATDNTLAQPRHRLARILSSEHVVFDLRGLDSDPEVYQRELTRLAESLKQSQPAAAGAIRGDSQDLGQGE